MSCGDQRAVSAPHLQEDAVTTPQPPITPGPDRPYTLDQVMGAQPATVAQQPYLHGGPPRGYAPVQPGPQHKPHWWRSLGTGGQVVVIIAAIMAPIIIAIALVTAYTERAGRGEVEVSITGCTFSGSEVLPAATVQFTATNKGSRSQVITLRWEYRDASGARVDTDSTRIEVPGRDTVRGEETTLLNAAASGGTCNLVGR